MLAYSIENYKYTKKLMSLELFQTSRVEEIVCFPTRLASYSLCTTRIKFFKYVL